MSSAPALDSRYDIIRLQQRFKTHKEDRSRSKACPATPSRQTRNRRSQRHTAQRSRPPQKSGRAAHRCRLTGHPYWKPALPGDPAMEVPGGKTMIVVKQTPHTHTRGKDTPRRTTDDPDPGHPSSRGHQGHLRHRSRGTPYPVYGDGGVITRIISMPVTEPSTTNQLRTRQNAERNEWSQEKTIANSRCSFANDTRIFSTWGGGGVNHLPSHRTTSNSSVWRRPAE